MLKEAQAATEAAAAKMAEMEGKASLAQRAADLVDEVGKVAIVAGLAL